MASRGRTFVALTVASEHLLRLNAPGSHTQLHHGHLSSSTTFASIETLTVHKPAWLMVRNFAPHEWAQLVIGTFASNDNMLSSKVPQFVLTNHC